MKQFKCPNCGAALELSSPLEYTVECPYCHQQVINDQAHSSGNQELLPRIIHSKINEDEVMETIVHEIIKGYPKDPTSWDYDYIINIPKFFFEQLVVSIHKFYIPYYLYEDKLLTEIIKARNGNDLTRYFTLDPVIPTAPSKLPFFSKDEIESDVEVLPPLEDAEDAWHRCSRSPGSIDLIYKIYLIYVPLWIVECKYKEKKYIYQRTTNGRWNGAWHTDSPPTVRIVFPKKERKKLHSLYYVFANTPSGGCWGLILVFFFFICAALTFQDRAIRSYVFYCLLALWLIYIPIHFLISKFAQGCIHGEDKAIQKDNSELRNKIDETKRKLEERNRKSAQDYINRKGWKNNSYSRFSSTHREEKQKKDTNWQHKNEKSNVRSNPGTNNQGMFNQKWVTSIYSSIKQFIKDNISVNVIKWGIILLLAIVGTIAISTIGIIVGNAVIKYVKKQSSSMNSSTAQWEPISNHTENESVEEESEEESVAPETGEEETLEEAEQQDGTGDMIDDNVPVIYGVEGYHRLNGKIDNYMITMEIDISGTTVNGSYYYDRYGSGSRLSLSGKYENGVVDMYETDSNGTITGRFVGVFGEEMIFKGLFVNQQEQQMVFQAKEY